MSCIANERQSFKLKSYTYLELESRQIGEKIGQLKIERNHLRGHRSRIVPLITRFAVTFRSYTTINDKCVLVR